MAGFAMSRERFPCGCVADDRKWRELCPAHRAEYDERHLAHLSDTKARRELEPAGQEGLT